MKNILIPCAALALVCGLISVSTAGEPAAISDSTLGSMGLGGMQKMSDTDGLLVRGKGYTGYGGGTSASVWGGSSANWYGGQSSNNNYEASSSWLGHGSSATGGSLSFAGKIQGSYAADPTGSALSLTICGGFAGGGAFAIAH